MNTTEELKQLCTNLVVKLDLDMDVADIDRWSSLIAPALSDESLIDVSPWQRDSKGWVVR